MIKVIVYDCDGVLVDSGNVILSYYNWMMSRCGLPEIDWAEDQLRMQAMSLADKDILEVLSGGDGEIFQQMLNISKNEQSNIGFEDMSLEANIIECLDFIKSNSIPMAVVTNRGKSLPSLLSHFKIEDYFQMLVTAHDVTHPKPSPEGLMKICGAFEITPSEILYIGDSFTDYDAAKACGANFIAYKRNLGDDAPVIYNHLDIKQFIKLENVGQQGL